MSKQNAKLEKALGALGVLGLFATGCEPLGTGS